MQHRRHAGVGRGRPELFLLSYGLRYENAARPGHPGAACTTRWVRATCATCLGKAIRHWLGK
jgi:hypothetical protein